MLSALPAQNDPNLLVGFETSDDAGIYRVAPDLALVQTVDFFTPLVDDPFTFGQIAATNALSDVYAMGGRPVTALAVVCFPQDADLAILEQIMRGGLSKMTEAALHRGGRAFGARCGDEVRVRSNRSRRSWSHYINAAARPGDALLLTKPIGTGVITTALKQGKAETAWVENAIRSMTTLNNAPRRPWPIANPGVHSITDITGFGLMGHGREMALGSGVVLEIDVASVPLIPGALDAVRLGAIPAGLLANREFAECLVADAPGCRDPGGRAHLLYDPQTAGGLLISVAQETAPRLF